LSRSADWTQNIFSRSNLLILEKDRKPPETHRDGQFAGGILLTFREFFIAQPWVGQLKKTAVCPREVRSLGRRVNHGDFQRAAGKPPCRVSSWLSPV
jgi:hypothetical protein